MLVSSIDNNLSIVQLIHYEVFCRESLNFKCILCSLSLYCQIRRRRVEEIWKRI